MKRDLNALPYTTAELLDLLTGKASLPNYDGPRIVQLIGDEEWSWDLADFYDSGFILIEMSSVTDLPIVAYQHPNAEERMAAQEELLRVLDRTIRTNAKTGKEPQWAVRLNCWENNWHGTRPRRIPRPPRPRHLEGTPPGEYPSTEREWLQPEYVPPTTEEVVH